MVKRMLIGVAVACALVVGSQAGAGADPVNAPKGEVLDIECDSGLGALTVALNGNGEFTPGHVTTSTQVGIPYAFHLEFTFTPSGAGAPEAWTEDSAKNGGPRNGRLATCTFSEVQEAPDGVFAVAGTVWITYTPAH
ncbi:hypothetical protein [Dermatobacter hominis]|uniref:hypothetical protein n=1 Tax=Dermatobacter hominis TaxID=2884263 RepID=UPI001D129552|nr:hypothetical protein [Dermatobacter hominis]UDY34545.1 hypothetical protein LH044_14525 [Dermatobacter hominis]